MSTDNALHCWDCNDILGDWHDFTSHAYRGHAITRGQPVPSDTGEQQ